MNRYNAVAGIRSSSNRATHRLLLARRSYIVGSPQKDASLSHDTLNLGNVSRFVLTGRCQVDGRHSPLQIPRGEGN